jgi:hypothetical protein
MATYQKFNSFVEAVAEKLHNLGSDQLKVALTNTAPVAANTVYADLTSPLATPFNHENRGIRQISQGPQTRRRF